MGKCNSCSKATTSCTCKRKPEPCCNSCTEKVSTNCVIYDVSPNRSNLTCFLGVNNGASLTKILEILDKKLCIPISKCARQKLGLGHETDISMAVVKMLDYICEQEDVKVKVSEDDAGNGYLFEKIETGDCVKKSIVTDYLGVQKVKIELDFPCIEDKLSCCGGNNTSISIQGSNTVCGNNYTLLTAVSNCSTPIVWSNGLTGPTIQATAGVYYATCGGRQSNIITITSTGNCGCEPIWRDIIPVEIYCGQVLSRDPCKKYIKQSNQCNNDVRWVEYTGSGSDGSGCPGCGPVTFIATRSQTFVRNNCATGCTSGSVTFSKNYYSTVSQAVVDTLATNDNNFLTEGQNYANSTGSCNNCPTIPTTPSPVVTPTSPIPVPTTPVTPSPVSPPITPIAPSPIVPSPTSPPTAPSPIAPSPVAPTTPTAPSPSPTVPSPVVPSPVEPPTCNCKIFMIENSSGNTINYSFTNCSDGLVYTDTIIDGGTAQGCTSSPSAFIADNTGSSIVSISGVTVSDTGGTCCPVSPPTAPSPVAPTTPTAPSPVEPPTCNCKIFMIENSSGETINYTFTDCSDGAVLSGTLLNEESGQGCASSPSQFISTDTGNSITAISGVTVTDTGTPCCP